MTTALVLGGARSGKSQWAEARFAGRPEVVYVATSHCDPDDPEWLERVALHRARRPASWRTVETLDVASAIRDAGDSPVLVDCLSVWLTRVLDDVGAWESTDGWEDALARRKEPLLEALARAEGDVVLVSNEVGLSVVPDNAAARMFRDELGTLNAQVGAVVDEVWFSIAGITKRWD